MGVPHRRWLMRGLLGALVLSGAFAGFVARRASRALRASEQEVRMEGHYSLAIQRVHLAINSDFQPVGAPAVFQQAAIFQDHLYLAGPAGLLEYGLDGAAGRQFLAGRDLPATSLTSLVPVVLPDSRDPELILASVQDGLFAFNGQSFRQILPQDAAVRSITAILPVSGGRLLVGTRKRGVLLFNGKEISLLHPTLAGLHVTALAGTEGDLWVGTLDHGVVHFAGGTSEGFSEDQGLPDRQIQCIRADGNHVYAGTAMGVAVFERGHFSHTIARGVLVSALLPAGRTLLVGTEDQGVLRVPLEPGKNAARAIGGAHLAEVEQFLSSGESIYVLTRDSLGQMNSSGLGWKAVLKPDTATLTDRNISALAADASGRLWIGYFDRGLDILELGRNRVTHVEDEHIFCVNRILPETKPATVSVATANGLVRFGEAGNEQQILTRADGLIADHVTDVAAYRGGLAVATPAGLTFVDGSGTRSMYAFHGLVNNHVYALGVSGDDLMAGTLGGLSALNRETLRVNYTANGSGLKHNWVTAVSRAGEDWFVGTYGAGVLSLDSTGRFHSFETATGSFEINPNALLVTPRHVFAGTLGKGVLIYDRSSEHWSFLATNLPSLNVTALAEYDGSIFIGTDNGLVRVKEEKLVP